MNIINVDYKWNGELKKRISTDYIIFHHAEAERCTVEDIHRWHQQDNGWVGIGYNFFIRKDGSVYTGRPEWACDADAYGYNNNSLSICFEGDFNKEQMTQEQIKAGIELGRYLMSKYSTIQKVFRHKDVNQTECPGKNFVDPIILEVMKGDKPMENNQEHWAEEYFKYLNENGIEVNERRFDNNISRGEVMALIARLYKKLKGE